MLTNLSKQNYFALKAVFLEISKPHIKLILQVIGQYHFHLQCL